MIRKILLLSVASCCFFLPAFSQEFTADHSFTDNVLDPADIEGQYNNCTPGENCWNGTSGGSVPNWSGTAAYWGYGGGILKWTSAINTALETAGMQIDGFGYTWYVKNFDTNYVEEQNDGDDYMRISVRIYDKDGNEVWGKQYNLDGTYGWTNFRGTEWFDESLVADDLGDVIIRAEGDDPGYWAGYYGPEFDVSRSYVKFIYSPIPLDPCDAVPVVDPSCEGFIGAAPEEDPAIKELVIIESTGSIPLSEDELSVLESLEKEETYEEVPVEITESQLEEETTSSVDALSVAQAAEANAIADAENTISDTLAATELALQGDIAQSQSTSQQAQQQSQQSMQEAQSSQQQSAEQSLESAGISPDGNISADNYLAELQKNNLADVELSIQMDSDTFEIAALDAAINDAVLNLIKMEQNIIREQIEESIQEEELAEQLSNEKEDELVAAALAGNDSEDAQAALLGFNPNFRAYQQSQIPDADFYAPKEIYDGQKNYDNPNGRFFNGASDALHERMVRQQYNK